MIEQIFSEAEYQVLMVALNTLQITGRDARLVVNCMDKVQECLNMFEQARIDAEKARLEADRQKHQELEDLIALEDKKASKAKT
jgi:histidyl-tRNA synthetase